MNWSDYFYYDETSPTCLRWKVDRFRGLAKNVKFICAGDVAGCINTKWSYSVVCVEQTQSYVHKVVWEMFNGKVPEGHQVDHLDGNSKNNSIHNLRVVTPAVNQKNLKGSIKNTSGAVGVVRCIRSCKTPGLPDRHYWRTRWKSLDGKDQSKLFPIAKYGEEGAFRMACEYRQRMLQELNEQGAGYTERHGSLEDGEKT